MFCNKCGSEIPADSKFCVKCGTKSETEAQPAQNYSYSTEENVNVGLVILSVIIPLIGLILGIVNLSNKNKRAGKAYLIAALISGFLAICIYASILAPTMLYYVDTAR